MQQNLRSLFDQALDGEPPPPPGDPVHQAMILGRRIRIRRNLLIGGSTATAITAALVAFTLALAPAAPPPVSIPAAMMAPADPACTWPVQDDATDVSIFLTDDITLAQIGTLRDALWSDPVVRAVRFESSSQAYQNFKRLWADSPDFAASVSPADLPQSFRVDLAEPAGYRAFAATFRTRTGVADLVGRSCRSTGPTR